MRIEKITQEELLRQLRALGVDYLRQVKRTYLEGDSRLSVIKKAPHDSLSIPRSRLVHKTKTFDLKGLNGISDKTLEIHFKLYEGYVKEANKLDDKLASLVKAQGIAERDMTIFSELKRRLGFEYGGMVLHEYYFANLSRSGNDHPAKNSIFSQAVKASFGNHEKWKADFVGVGKMRGVGWAICCQDPVDGRLSNHWIGSHEEGYVARLHPVLVMDVWEHAFILDYKPAERGKYIEAFFSNIDWTVIESRLQSPATRL